MSPQFSREPFSKALKKPLVLNVMKKCSTPTPKAQKRVSSDFTTL